MEVRATTMTNQEVKAKKDLTQRDVGVVIPVFNEEESLPFLFEQIEKIGKEIPRLKQWIFVDDGSTDRSWEMLLEARKKHPSYRLLKLSRNFGTQAACLAGFDVIDTDAVVVIDADLQDPPELINQMIKDWDDGNDIVYSVRKTRAGESWFKIWTASLFSKVFSRMSEIPVPINAGDFKLIDRKVLKVIQSIKERRLFIRGIVSWVGFRQKPLYFDRNPRIAGTTKYNFHRLNRLAWDALSGYSNMPFYWLTGIGGVSLILTGIGFLTSLMGWLLGSQLPAWTFPTILIGFFGSLQLMAFGVIGEYVTRIMFESKDRPSYILECDSALPLD